MGIGANLVEATQRRHNAIRVAQAVGFGVLSLVLWYVSYWVFRLLILLPCFYAGLSVSPAIVSAIVWACMALLVVDGVRNGKAVFDVAAAAHSPYFSITGTRSESALRWWAGRPLGWAWYISQVLLSAPRCAVRAVRAARSLVPFDRGQLDLAQKMAEALSARNAWVPVESFKGHLGELAKLRRLDIIRGRLRDGVAEIKISPDIVHAEDLA